VASFCCWAMTPIRYDICCVSAVTWSCRSLICVSAEVFGASWLAFLAAGGSLAG
jgi:hypothetical protein